MRSAINRDGVTEKLAIAWLDRQKAITDDEWERATDVVKAERDELRERVSELESCGQHHDQPKRDDGADCESDSREKLEDLVRYMEPWITGQVRPLVLRQMEKLGIEVDA